MALEFLLIFYWDPKSNDASFETFADPFAFLVHIRFIFYYVGITLAFTNNFLGCLLILSCYKGLDSGRITAEEGFYF